MIPCDTLQELITLCFGKWMVTWPKKTDGLGGLLTKKKVMFGWVFNGPIPESKEASNEMSSNELLDVSKIFARHGGKTLRNTSSLIFHLPQMMVMWLKL